MVKLGVWKCVHIQVLNIIIKVRLKKLCCKCSIQGRQFKKFSKLPNSSLFKCLFSVYREGLHHWPTHRVWPPPSTPKRVWNVSNHGNNGLCIDFIIVFVAFKKLRVRYWKSDKDLFAATLIENNTVKETIRLCRQQQDTTTAIVPDLLSGVVLNPWQVVVLVGIQEMCFLYTGSHWHRGDCAPTLHFGRHTLLLLIEM